MAVLLQEHHRLGQTFSLPHPHCHSIISCWYDLVRAYFDNSYCETEMGDQQEQIEIVSGPFLKIASVRKSPGHKYYYKIVHCNVKQGLCRVRYIIPWHISPLHAMRTYLSRYYCQLSHSVTQQLIKFLPTGFLKMFENRKESLCIDFKTDYCVKM